MESVEDHQPSAGAGPLETKTVADVDSLRALADPTRLAILAALMERHDDLPVMSVKELAARLGEPQTKLYRHVKQLEAAGLIRVAATRLVSGILEQRYQACQRDLAFGDQFMRENADDAEAAMRALLDSFRDGFFTAFRDKRLAPDAVPAAETYRRPTIFALEARVSPARAAEMGSKLQEVVSSLSDKGAEEDPDGILVDILIGYYASVEPGQQ
jgi:DNA-binding transcriptional ArsR family regulator